MLGSQTQAERDKVSSSCSHKRCPDRVFPTEEADLQAEEPRGEANGGTKFEHGQSLDNLRGGQLERGVPLTH